MITTVCVVPLKPRSAKILPHDSGDSVTRVNDSSHDFWWLELDSSHVENDCDSTQLESRFSQNDSTRVTVNDSRLESESFLQKL